MKKKPKGQKLFFTTIHGQYGQGMDRGRVCSAMTKNDGNVVQHGGYISANRFNKRHGLQSEYQLLDIHAMVN